MRQPLPFSPLRTVAGRLAVLWCVFRAISLPGAEVAGFTEPYRDVDVAASEMGRLVTITVSEGQRVTAGQVLARLDDDVLRATVEVARANRESAGRLEAAEAELRLCRESLDKLEELSARHHATQREVDRARTQVEVAEARLKATQQELTVKSLELERSKKQLEQRYIVSPIAGLVTQRFKDEGEFVSPSDPVVIRVVQLDPLLVVFAVPVAQARPLFAAQTVRVRVESVAAPLEGVVEFVSPTVDAQSGTTRVRVRLPNPNENIRSGITCYLLLPSPPTQATEVVPPRAKR